MFDEDNIAKAMDYCVSIEEDLYTETCSSEIQDWIVRHILFIFVFFIFDIKHKINLINTERQRENSLTADIYLKSQIKDNWNFGGKKELFPRPRPENPLKM